MHGSKNDTRNKEHLSRNLYDIATAAPQATNNVTKTLFKKKKKNIPNKFHFRSI